MISGIKSFKLKNVAPFPNHFPHKNNSNGIFCLNSPNRVLREFSKVLQFYFTKERRISKSVVKRTVDKLIERTEMKGKIGDLNDSYVYDAILSNLTARIIIHNIRKINIKILFDKRNYDLIAKIVEIFSSNDYEVDEETFYVSYEQIFIKEKMKHRLRIISDYYIKYTTKNKNVETLARILNYSLPINPPSPAECKALVINEELFSKISCSSPCDLFFMRIISHFPIKDEGCINQLIKVVFRNRNNSFLLTSAFRILSRQSYARLRKLEMEGREFVALVMEYLVECAGKVFSLKMIEEQLYSFLLKLYMGHQKSIEGDKEIKVNKKGINWKSDVFCNNKLKEDAALEECKNIVNALIEYESGKIEEYEGFDRYVILNMIRGMPASNLFI
ncbi:hypothetical protein NUSPORA_02668 [Nucleospora cyclopteri]